MLDAVVLDPDNRAVVGLVPRSAFREIFLSVEPSDGVCIFDPAELSQEEPEAPQGRGGEMVGYGGDGGGSNSPSRRHPILGCWVTLTGFEPAISTLTTHLTIL